MKKTLSVLLVLTMILAFIPVGAITASAEQSGDYTYFVTDAKAKIADYTGSGTAITIPDTLGGFPVTAIGSWAFSYCSTITSIIIPDSVTTIENYAFYWCSKATTISVGAGVNSIGFGVFTGCSKLTQINVAAANAFYSSLSGILFDEDQNKLIKYAPGKTGTYTVPAGVTAIEPGAFYDCNLLTSVTVGPGVVSIGLQAFGYASGLTQIIVDEANTAYSSLNGVLFDEAKKTLIQFPCANSTAYTVPDGVEIIGDYAFFNCRKVTAVTLPTSLIGIGVSAFNYCNGLTALTIPDNVREIGMSAFTYCSKVTTIYIGAKVETIGINAFNSCELLTSLTIPDSVKTISDVAFAWCKALTTVSIGSGLETLGEKAFAYCGNVIGFTVAASNTSFSSLDGVLFDEEQKSLIQFPAGKSGSYTVPDGVESLADFSFNSSGLLTYIDIPASVSAIGASAFLWCEGLYTAIIRNGAVNIGQDAFEGCASVTIVGLPGSSAESYANMISFRFIPLEEGIFISRYPAKMMYNHTEPLDSTGLEVMSVDGDLNIETLTAYSIEGYNADTYGIQTITVSYNGYSAEFEVSVCIISSNHPYQDNMDQTWTYTHPEPADMLQVKFSDQTNTEEDSDFIYIYDIHDNLLATYTGTQLQGETILVAGNSFKIRLTSDSSVTDYGFDIISVTAFETVISSLHPYENDTDESWTYTHPEQSDKLKVTFSMQTIVEEAYDFIYIYDGNDDLFGTYTGAMLAGRSIIIDGNSFRIRLTTDDSTTAYGFDIVSVESFNSVISSDHPYNNDVDISWFYGHPATVTYLELTFSPETSFEDGYDYVYLYDENDDLVGAFTGLELAGTTQTVFGSSFTIQLTSDSSQTDYGFDILTVTGFGTGGPLLAPVENSGCVIDSDNGYIYGLAPGITSLDGYAQVPTGYRVEYGLSQLGTGTYIDVINDLTDNIVESYLIIFFGDINGDGSIDSMDAGTAVDVENYQVVLDPVEDAAYRMAADINGDGTIDSLDAGLMVDFENYAVGIDQTTGLYYTL